MAKFIRVGNRGINLDRINHYEIGDAVGGTLGRGQSASSGAQAALVLFFGNNERLAIQNAAEAKLILEAIHGQ
jgi:hypothetical protein